MILERWEHRLGLRDLVLRLTTTVVNVAAILSVVRILITMLFIHIQIFLI